jgi:hypothetical protein
VTRHNLGSECRQGQEIFSSYPKRPDHLRSPPSLLFKVAFCSLDYHFRIRTWIPLTGYMRQQPHLRQDSTRGNSNWSPNWMRICALDRKTAPRLAFLQSNSTYRSRTEESLLPGFEPEKFLFYCTQAWNAKGNKGSTEKRQKYSDRQTDSSRIEVTSHLVRSRNYTTGSACLS